jgi:hypothetical protein
MVFFRVSKFSQWAKTELLSTFIFDPYLLMSIVYMYLKVSKSQRIFSTFSIKYLCRECVRVGARTRRYLGHHLLHPLILRLLVLCAPAEFEAQSSAPADPNS